MIQDRKTPIIVYPTGNPRISKQEFITKHMFKMRVCLGEELKTIQHMSTKATRLERLKKRVEIRLRYFPTIGPRLDHKLHSIMSMAHSTLRTVKMDELEKQLANWTLK